MEEGSADKGHVTIVYPAYPNVGQERELLRTLGVVRGLYNHFLAESIADVMEGDRFPTPREMNKAITVMRGRDIGLGSVAVFTLRDAPLRVHAAMTSFAKLSARSGELRLPRFKSESRYRSLAFDPKGVKFDGRRIVLGRWMKLRCGNLDRNRKLHRPEGGRIVTARIVRKGSGRWYVHITFEVDRRYRSEIDLSDPAEPEAYDFGLCDIITDSKGERIGAPDLSDDGSRVVVADHLDGLVRIEKAVDGLGLNGNLSETHLSHRSEACDRFTLLADAYVLLFGGRG